MAERGWYSDPGGAPGLFRYFDGRQWTQQTTRDPQQPFPGGSPRNQRRVSAPLLAGLVGVLILVLVAGIAIWQTTRDRVTTDPPLPSSTVTGWDDSSPTSSPTPEPSPPPDPTSPSPTATASSRSVSCDTAHDNQLDPPPEDGRVHGGPLSFKAIPRWDGPYSTGRFFFSHDSYVQELELPEKLPWAASAQTGVLEMGDYPGSSKAALRLLQCLITSDFYASVDVKIKDNSMAPTKIGSTPATQLNALLTFSHPELKTKGSMIRIIVVDSSPTTYYFHAVPKERSDLIKLTDAATESLTVK